MFRTLKNSHNVEDLRLLAKQRLPGPIFHYIDGAADDETTYRRNTSAYADCDLVPNVLAGVQDIDMSVTVMGQKLAMPVFCSPTALQRLFHHDGERAVARAGGTGPRGSRRDLRHPDHGAECGLPTGAR